MWKESFELTSGDFPSTFHLPPSTSIRIIGPPGYWPPNTRPWPLQLLFQVDAIVRLCARAMNPSERWGNFWDLSVAVLASFAIGFKLLV